MLGIAAGCPEQVQRLSTAELVIPEYLRLRWPVGGEIPESAALLTGYFAALLPGYFALGIKISV